MGFPEEARTRGFTFLALARVAFIGFDKRARDDTPTTTVWQLHIVRFGPGSEATERNVGFGH
jgi:hypothetical protein